MLYFEVFTGRPKSSLNFILMNKYLVCITGPTGIGKTSKSIALAKAFDTEIISADSRQFYKEMSIGVAVPSGEELAAVPHHFIQHISADTEYNAGDFERDALKKLDELFQKYEVVFMVGGSGLFVKAVTEGLNEFPEVSPEIRENLNLELAERGIESLQQKLIDLDPDYAETADMQNHRRIIRALEICLGTGKAYSDFLNKPRAQRPFKSIKIGLTAPRELIYSRIEKRVDLMMQAGLLEEAEKLYVEKCEKASQTIGYSELFKFFDKEWSLDFAIDEIKKNTRRFAKRQLTWFRKDKSITWFSYDTDPGEIITFIRRQINPD